MADEVEQENENPSLCPRCKTVVDEEATRCPECGEYFPALADRQFSFDSEVARPVYNMFFAAIAVIVIIVVVSVLSC